MKKFIINILIAFSLIYIISACSKVDTTGASSLYVPTNADTTANATLSDLKKDVLCISMTVEFAIIYILRKIIQ
jgi:hypothetical protein